ncbi:MAG: phosphoglycolate phosphatase, partial [Thermoplasmata archaeon]
GDSTNAFLAEMSKKTSMRPIFTNKWREASTGFDIDEKDIDFIKAEAEKRGLVIFNSGYSWHLMNRGEDKAFAVSVLMKKYNIDAEEMLVIGDSENDLPMFDLPVHRASPANSSECIKKRSEYVSEFSYGEEIPDIYAHFGLL